MEVYNGFENMNVWQKAHAFVLDVHKFTKVYPKDELFGLTSQYRRAAVSIAANIAEGSINECRYYIILSKDLGYVSPTDSNALYDNLVLVQKLLASYARGLVKNTSSNY